MTRYEDLARLLKHYRARARSARKLSDHQEDRPGPHHWWDGYSEAFHYAAEELAKLIGAQLADEGADHGA